MTKREMFNTIKEITEVKANEEMVAFINHEIELLDKKSSKSTPTKTQKENETLVKVVFDELSRIGKAVTISELQIESEVSNSFSNQKLSALMKKLVDCGRVEKTTDKKKSYFSVATDEVEGE